MFVRAIILLVATLSAVAIAASLRQVTNFGENPTNVSMYIYVPDKLAMKPPILLFPHWCHGSAQAAYSGSQYSNLANTYGFIVIYPDSPNQEDKCWDVSSKQTLTHNGGGDSLGIVSMVRYTLDKYNGDPNRVFVSGISSGAMMTNVLIGAYPDVFAAGSAFAGVPFGCYSGPSFNYWNADCAEGRITKSREDWAAMVKTAYPSYTGWRPKMQILHGTRDEIINYTNYKEAVKQWTAVLGLSELPTSTTQNTPLQGWTKYVYGEDRFQAYSAAGVPHNIPNQESIVMAWFDLRCTTGDCFSRPGGGNGTVFRRTFMA
ncbi:carbohydrate esterase family 1 protein [Patellaria atrata CBS 101060]|uniref:Carboxylic ester hydrolase n=1 Tax=Patellaria atrata CBS 101060 TaxID=1346257 RepID=A0A9P4VR46_9PEZI|nr:carbohydrate esterase family 1 protein [Patellaria atrata CBS 101060]